MPTKLRTVYLVREPDHAGRMVAAPKVWLEVTAKGDVRYGVEATGRSLRQARERAQMEFSALRRYVRSLGPRPEAARPRGEGTNGEA